MTKKILTEISLGELFDKISILEIKLKKIQDKKKLIFIKKEYKILMNVKRKIQLKKNINIFYKKLKKVNTRLWNIENKIKKYEKIKKFNKDFINLARKVYQENDQRSYIKLEINKSMNSNIIEMKSYSNYK